MAFYILMTLGSLGLVPAAMADNSGYDGHIWNLNFYPRVFTGDSPQAVCDQVFAYGVGEFHYPWRNKGPLPTAGTYVCAMDWQDVNPNWSTAPMSRTSCVPGYELQPDGSCSRGQLPVQVCLAGSPVIPGTGTKTFSDEGFDGISDMPFTLAYRSDQGGSGWTFSWQRGLDISKLSAATPQIMATRDDGTVSTFVSNGAGWSAAGTQDSLQPVADGKSGATGWQYTSVDTGTVEIYDVTGKLQSVRERNGRTTTLAYNSGGQLSVVTAQNGRRLSFSYDGSGRVASVTTPDGSITSFAYNAGGMLSSVTRPDGSVRQYVYEDSRFPAALTGVVDEKGNRYATYAYDDQARTIRSGLAGGVNQYQFQYGNNYQTAVTDPTGKASVYSFLKQNGVLLPTSISAPCGLCGSTRQDSSYDTNNNLIQETDYLGNVTTHAYDSRKQEIQRVEGAGRASARTITTEWHPNWNLRTRVASPTKLETYGYDSNGNRTSYSETPTADPNGSQGFSAAAMGPTRTTTWTYTADGQVASSSGPRTDVTTSTTYVYRTVDDSNSPPQYRKGDLHQIVDPLGHITTINQYDANGRLLQMTDANGTVMSFTYSNRGWLTSQTTAPSGGAAQTTSYAYDKVGQLTKVTQSDGGTVSFSYDGAHRMIGAADSSGNSIGYTLDVMGNRVQEQTKDPSGSLARQITRVFDGMNRPLQVIVGMAPPPSVPAPLVKVTPAGVTASSCYAPYTPSNAIDGDLTTTWLASSFPIQWIEVDLGEPVALRSIRMQVNQNPNGQTTHVLTGGVLPEPTAVLQTLSGTTSMGQWLTFTPDTTFPSTRFIRITTTSSPSWVAWTELEFYK